MAAVKIATSSFISFNQFGNSSPTPKSPPKRGLFVFPSWEGPGVGSSTEFKVRG